jgi:dTDP-glucose pyrophosphorylase
MAGRGVGVRELGECKPAIRVLDRPVLGWCLTGLSRVIASGDRIAITTTRHFESTFAISELARDTLSRLGLRVDLKIVQVEATPPGPAASVYAARACFRGSQEAVVVNCDQFVQFEFPSEGSKWDAFVPLYVNSTGRSSYAEISDGRIMRIAEKQLVSHYASAGVYGFASGDLLADVLDKSLSGEPHYAGEFYVGPAINDIVGVGGIVLPVSVLAKYDLGGVAQIRAFEATMATIRTQF